MRQTVGLPQLLRTAESVLCALNITLIKGFADELLSTDSQQFTLAADREIGILMLNELS